MTDINEFAFNGCTSLNTVVLNKYIFENITSMYDGGRILRNLTTGGKVYVPAYIIDELELTNSYLDNESYFTRSDEAEDGYYVYTKI